MHKPRRAELDGIVKESVQEVGDCPYLRNCEQIRNLSTLSLGFTAHQSYTTITGGTRVWTKDDERCVRISRNKGV